ncbi:uncharacterized protein LOC127263510 isoform X2 [Andrographis paniculata]|uniref:uncharacterized protein LOC127263510 isoform X2 n=1 Tax=Andrographis paniculata TaxID=175694 RepID=UPI0021E96DEF|nr:uncharacterized protein LOC127263510 isoform X2 [Andrographis paniculata]
MRSRSHRLQVSEPRHDDWVDGSWTVDCICGVNFDDGEEMVDCDECGVWVHTRCVRYVKSDKSFACDSCKSKSSANGGGGVRNDSEETEVAEFLVELPTKTLMDNPNPATVSARRPFRLWTDFPMEERVHVQGVPGGEPGLFSGVKLSSVFGPELWKSTGYVPKKFNFRYDEFAHLDPGGKVEEKKEDAGNSNAQENGSQDDNGAGVLFSLLKVNENTVSSPVANPVGVKSPVEGGGFEEALSPTQKKSDGQKPVTESPEEGVKKESGTVRIVLHTGKRKKEEKHGVSKDQHVKKKVRTVEKEGGLSKRATHGSEADRGSKAARDDTPSGKELPGDQLSDSLGECATNLASKDHGAEATLRNDVSSEGISRQKILGQTPLGSEASKTSNALEPIKETSDSHPQNLTMKEEVPEDVAEAGIRSVEIDSHDKELVDPEATIAAPDGKESQDGKDSDTDEANSQPNKKLKGELGSDDHGRQKAQPLNDVKLDAIKVTPQYPESSVDILLDETKVIEASAVNSEATERKVIAAIRGPSVGSSRADKSDDMPSKREPVSSGGAMVAKKRSSGLKHSSDAADELLKSDSTAKNYSTASYRRKAVVSVVKPTSTSGDVVPKPPDRMVTTSQNTSILRRQKDLSENNVGSVKNNAAPDSTEHDKKSGRTKKLVKESSRLNSLSKVSASAKLSHSSDSKKPPSDSKDPGIHSSSKGLSVTNVASNHHSGDSTNPQAEGPSNVQNKVAAPAVPGKSEKHHQSNNSSSRGNVVTAPGGSNVPSTLSDEELALLLHQELNSSPRVPRVPRMRHAGSLPQLACSTATSMLMKRTSSGGTKDHSMSSRRRAKDFNGETSHGSLEASNETKKERKPSLPDSRRQDSGCSIDPLSRREADGVQVKSVQSMKKTNLGSSRSTSSDANGHNGTSTRPSSRNVSDDDPQIGGRQTHRTLPGLIAEIMSEGKRMTYEELCNAVLPHWPHLRKHNGERYAYSSHSQAVLDCLRNRSEWARLVDRGPKTSASRKRRQLDTDSLSIESQDDEDNRVKNSKDIGSKSFESQQEEFPKGKRKARKRRRLALQGRRVVRRRRRAEVISDDESESYSDTSEDSTSSEEEIQGGGGTSVGGSEASASSDDV